MARAIFIYGKSGSGKSSSIRTLPKEETLIINVNGKDLPFRDGNKFIVAKTDNYDSINDQLQKIDKEKKNIQYVVIDDSQYLIVNQFMRGHSTLGKDNNTFSFYNVLADNFWKLVFGLKHLRNDLTVVFLHHAEVDQSGFIKPKTIGKLLDEKVDIAGMFTIVLLAVRDGSENYFLTQNDGNNCAKSPMEMFEKEKIPNDLKLVCDTVYNYYNPQAV